MDFEKYIPLKFTILSQLVLEKLFLKTLRLLECFSFKTCSLKKNTLMFGWFSIKYKNSTINDQLVPKKLYLKNLRLLKKYSSKKNSKSLVTLYLKNYFLKKILKKGIFFVNLFLSSIID